MNPKTLATYFLFFISFPFAVSQDTIIKRNSEIIVAKIIEINPTDIKFKKFENLSGPLYIEKRYDIQKINYTNGSVDIFDDLKPTEPIKVHSNKTDYVESGAQTNYIDLWTYKRYRQRGVNFDEKRMHEIMLNTGDPKLTGLVKDAKRSQRGQLIGFVGIPFAAAAYGFLLTSTIYHPFSSNSDPDPVLLTSAGVCLIIGVACPVVSHNSRKRRIATDNAMVKVYNEKY